MRLCCDTISRFLACEGNGQSQARGSKRLVERILVDENTAIRFFYDPPGGDYFHAPLVFRPVKDGDSRLNTAPVLERDGLCLYRSPK